MPESGALKSGLGSVSNGLKCIRLNVSPFPPPAAADFIANLGRMFPPFDKYLLL